MGYVELARAILEIYQRLAESTVEDIEDPRGIETHCACCRRTHVSAMQAQARVTSGYTTAESLPGHLVG